MRNFCKYDSPIGKLCLIEENGKLIGISFEDISFEYIEKETEFLIWCKKELNEYFKRERKKFTFPIKMYGTEFQKMVWKALERIPYGETKSYKEIAEFIGKAKACRAVGMANNKNPLPIVIPCHRVIGANGKLVGYGGGIDKKITLLKLEKGNQN